MKSKSAESWRYSALFRVLAFLDSTGEQSFNLAEEVDSKGRVLRRDAIFGDSTAIHAILSCGLEALRENICFLFSDHAERDAILVITGRGHVLRRSASAQPGQHPAFQLPVSVTEKLSRSASVSPKPSEAVAGPATDAAVTTPPGEPASAGAKDPTPEPQELPSPPPDPFDALPEETDWSRAVLRPHSLAKFGDRFANGFTLNLLMRLQEVMGVSSSALTDGPLVEQFFVDALDRWMESRGEGENGRMVLACGVQPPVLEAATARSAELPHALVDFVVDVVFPTADDLLVAIGASAAVQDWLIQTYQLNHESIDVEDASGPGGEGDDKDDAAATAAATEEEAERKRRRLEEESRAGLAGWQPEDDEVVLTADNIDRYMRENPALIPRDILREKRRSWMDPRVTAFELESHYTAAELRAAAKEVAGLTAPVEAAAWAVAAAAEYGYTAGAPTAELLRDAGRASKKADCVDVLLRLHVAVPEVSNGDVAAEGEPQGAGTAREPSESPDNAVNIADPALSAAQLIKHFSLADLQSFVTGPLGLARAPAKKKKCATNIVAARRKGKADGS